MKNKIVLFASIIALAIVSATIISSCNKSFDTPPGASDPNITATHTIKQLKAMHTVAGQLDMITTDVIIVGTVVADDKSGNIYKELYIQDATGGLAVQLDATGLFTTYPVGRKVFINCKGLCISDNRKTPQLGIRAVTSGAPSLQGIPSGLIKNYITGGSLNNPVVAKVIPFSTYAQPTNISMADDNLCTLIKLENFEVSSADIAKTYADTSAYKLTQNINIGDCSNNKTIIRSSGYANFAGVKVPQGNGSVTAIFTTYDNTRQLIIRDTTDVQFTNARCAAAPATLTTIAALKALYTGSDVNLGAVKISGTVISDAAAKNMGAGNMVIQDATAGIDLYFGSAAATTNFVIGDSVEVNLNGGTLTSYNGLIEVSLASSALPATKLATGKTVTPLVVTTAQFNSQIAANECRLVRIVGAVASPAGTYVGSKTLTDAAGTAVLYTSNNATFGGSTLPTVSSDWVGYGTRFNATVQFNIRNLSDVTPSSTPGPGPGPTGGIALTTSPLTFDFNSIASGLPTGIFVKQESTSSAIGNDATPYGSGLSSKTVWNQTSLGVKNFASATGLTATSDQTAQDASTNRALGFRQTGTAPAGGDPNLAFAFKINNTTGKTNLKLEFLLQSLDNSIGRTTVWTVDYGIGDNPTSFTSVTTSPASLSTSPTWGSTPVTVNFPAALNNNAGPIWIRVVTSTATTGSGSRPSSAIDDVKFTWQ